MASHATSPELIESHGPDRAHDASHDHGGLKSYGTILGLLFILTAVTVGVSYIDFGNVTVNLLIAMTIATTKASLVALYFMHLRYESPTYAIILNVSVILVGLLIAFSLMDLSNRDTLMPGNYKDPQGIVVPTFAKEKKATAAEHGSAHDGAAHDGTPVKAGEKH